MPWCREEDEDGGEDRGGGEFTVHPVLLGSGRGIDRWLSEEAMGLMARVDERTIMDRGQSLFGQRAGAGTEDNDFQ